MSDEAKRIKELARRYADARVSEALAGQRDAPLQIVKGHHERGKAAWSEMMAAIEALVARAGCVGPEAA